MRYALINPNWSFEGSIYFGCREPHLPLEFGYAGALLTAAGHACLLVDAQLEDLDGAEILARVAAFRPDFTVITIARSAADSRTAPRYSGNDRHCRAPRVDYPGCDASET
jgi:anaerobic magnesium-protoporphyrin IX monomethyl ester cyclase